VPLVFFFVNSKKKRNFASMKIEDAIARFTDYIAFERRMAKGTVKNYTADLHDLALLAAKYGINNVEEVDS
jgi:site-specific recombinase XerC